jgi:hypothetical protein
MFQRTNDGVNLCEQNFHTHLNKLSNLRLWEFLKSPPERHPESARADEGSRYYGRTLILEILRSAQNDSSVTYDFLSSHDSIIEVSDFRDESELAYQTLDLGLLHAKRDTSGPHYIFFNHGAAEVISTK